MINLLFFFLGILLTCTTARAKDARSWAEIHVQYPNISNDTLEKIHYHLLPSDHPIREKLDELFLTFRITQDEESLKKANFTHTASNPASGAIVTEHPNFAGYIFKLYTDKEKKPDHINCLLKRVVGAAAILKHIESNNTGHLFCVPRKWIYLIPPVSSEYTPKECLVIAEKINLLPYKVNIEKWKSNLVPKTTLNKLFKILSDLGLSDSIYPSNIQFTHDGKIAFVDTECCYWWPKPSYFPILGNYLSDDNKAYWLSLTDL